MIKLFNPAFDCIELKTLGLVAENEVLRSCINSEKIIQDNRNLRIVEKTYQNENEHWSRTYRFTAANISGLQLAGQCHVDSKKKIGENISSVWTFLLVIFEYGSSGFLLPVSFLLPGFTELFMVSASRVAWALLGLIAAALVWRNARRRYRAGWPAALWAVAAFAAPIVAIPLYAQFRPEGELWACGKCGRKGLLSLARCPHCGAAGEARLPRG